MAIPQRHTWDMTRRTMLGTILGVVSGLTSQRAQASTSSARQLSHDALKRVRNWGCQYQDVDLAAIAASNLDMIVLDPSLNDSARQFLTREECRLLKTKPDGNRRLVLGYLCVGEVDTKRWYWSSKLRNAPPVWVGRENPQWPGSRSVQIWNREWWSLVFDGRDSILSRILNIGFDGVFLDRVDGYADWEEARPSVKRDMVDLVQAVASSARAKNPEFIVVAQNAEPLLANLDFVETLDGHNKESLLTGLQSPNTYNSEQDVDWSLNFIRGLQSHGKCTFATEYITDPAIERAVRDRLLALQFVPFFGVRALDQLPSDGGFSED